MDPSAIIDFIVGLIEQIIAFIIQLFADFINILVAVFNAIAQVINSIITFLENFPEHLKDFLDDLWNEVIVPAIEKIQQIYDDIQTWLQNLLDPIIQFIQEVRAWFLKYIYPWIQRVQNIISITRAILSALRILGVKWAAKLDADLAKIQGYITGVFQDIIKPLNESLTWLNFLADPAGLFRTQTLSNSLFANLSSVYRSVNWGKNRGLSASEAQNTQEDISLAGGGANVLTRNADGSVTYSDASQRINANASKAWNYFGAPKV